ncbi:hypothetical protein Tsp_03835 [Trichinella spiralis]|uniref:hypothetical protein n=1 Tax=Trichinella spiralis TaxID=6334 RepID=UPI0001EFC2D1|nr:hypothetical protein Tsp_03835 [Trichinella spiralis]
MGMERFYYSWWRMLDLFQFFIFGWSFVALTYSTAYVGVDDGITLLPRSSWPSGAVFYRFGTGVDASDLFLANFSIFRSSSGIAVSNCQICPFLRVLHVFDHVRGGSRSQLFVSKLRRQRRHGSHHQGRNGPAEIFVQLHQNTGILVLGLVRLHAPEDEASLSCRTQSAERTARQAQSDRNCR